MRGLWQRLILSLTPGVRTALTVWTVLFVAGFALAAFSVADVAGWLGLTAPEFRHGQFWRIVTYALMPVNVMDWLMDSLALICFGGMLERIWQPWDFFLYCLIAAIGSGLAKIALQPASLMPLLGPGPIVLALMIAAGRVLANERMTIPPSLELTMQQIVILFTIFSVVMMVCAMGWINMVIRVSGGGLGLLYLWLRSHMGQPREARSVVSRRINRLEL